MSKETVSKSCMEESYIVVPRAKVLPRNVEPGSSTKRDDGVRAEELPKETVSKSCTHSDVPRAKVLPGKETSKSCTKKIAI